MRRTAVPEVAPVGCHPVRCSCASSPQTHICSRGRLSLSFLDRALADTRQMGKLNKDQFALAMYLIQQKVSKGIDPPQVLLPEMIPPAERTTPVQVNCLGE